MMMRSAAGSDWDPAMWEMNEAEFAVVRDEFDLVLTLLRLPGHGPDDGVEHVLLVGIDGLLVRHVGEPAALDVERRLRTGPPRQRGDQHDQRQRQRVLHKRPEEAVMVVRDLGELVLVRPDR